MTHTKPGKTAVMKGMNREDVIRAVPHAMSAFPRMIRAAFLQARFLLPFLLLGWSLTACDAPTDVGADLIGESGGEPQRVRLLPESITAETTPQTTGAVRSSISGFANQVFTVLTGTVNDPFFGQTSATGFMDVTAPLTADAFRGSTLQAAELRLQRRYVYGDTLTGGTLIVSSMPEHWEALNRTADTTLTIGPEIARVDFTPTDSLITIPLPESWLTEQASLLQSIDFDTLFHGFAFQTLGNNSVLGFNGPQSLLRIEADTDTVSFLASQLLSTIQHEPGPELPDGRLAIRAGIGQTVSMTFAFADSVFSGSVLNRAALNLHADSLTLQQNTPPAFSRPAIAQLNLTGIRDVDGTRTLLRSALPDDEQRYIFPSNTARPNTTTLLRSIQDAILGSPDYDRYVIEVVSGDVSINSLLLFGPEDGERSPDLLLTLIKSD